VPQGEVVSVGTVDVALPKAQMPQKYWLKATIAADGKTVSSNEWELFAFPTSFSSSFESECENGRMKLLSRTPTLSSNSNSFTNLQTSQTSKPLRIVTDISEGDLRAALAKGERVVLLGVGPFKSLPSTFRIGMAGRCAGDFATVINPHPIFDGFPHDGYCGWQFRRLMEGGRTVQLEAGVPYAPIVEVASPVKFTIRQASLFEYRVGTGRLLVCSFKFDEKDPAAEWLKAKILSYAASDAFEPKTALTDAQLAAVLSAPLISGAENKNEARNPGDPSSDVRAGALAQP